MATTDTESPAASAAAPLGVAGRVWLAACAAFAAVAFRGLLSFQPDRALPDALEEWFFVPSDTISPLVVVLAAWLFFRRVGRLRALPSAAGSLAGGVLLLTAAVATHAWATWTGANDLLPPALMLSLCAGLWLWKGGAAVRAGALPVAFLGFAMALPAPAFNEVVFRLQLATADLAGLMLYFLGIPHFVAGEQIERTHELFSVIESCSGIRSIEILTMVAILMADLFRRGKLHSWLLVLLAPLVAFGLNGVRALLLILNPHSEVGAIHNLQGIAILLAGLVLLFLWDGLLEKLPRGAPPAPGAPAVLRAPHAGAVWVLATALAGMAAVALTLPRWEPAPAPPPAMAELAAGLGFAEALEVDRLFLGSTGFRETLLRSVSFGRGNAIVFVGLGARVNRARSPLSPKTELPGSGWVTEQEAVLQIEDGGPAVRVRVMRSGSHRWLVHHWYEGSLGFGAEALRAWLALDRSPWRRDEEIVAVRVGIPLFGALENSQPEAEAEFLSFYSVLRPLLATLGERAAGKNFSEFSRSGKTFSAPIRAPRAVNRFDFSRLRTFSESARDLLLKHAGATGAPRGSNWDLRSLG